MKLSTEIINFLLVAGFILFGAIVHATTQLKVCRERKETFTVFDFVILFIIATFSGSLFGILSSILWSSTAIIILFSATGSFLGMAGLNKISASLLELIVYKIGSSKHEK